MTTIQHLSDATFDQDITGETPVLVDFWAEWCGPCRMVAPVLEQIAAEQADTLRVAKLNIDENPEAPARFGVTGIPTLILSRTPNPLSASLASVRSRSCSPSCSGTSHQPRLRRPETCRTGRRLPARSTRT